MGDIKQITSEQYGKLIGIVCNANSVETCDNPLADECIECFGVQFDSLPDAPEQKTCEWNKRAFNQYKPSCRYTFTHHGNMSKYCPYCGGLIKGDNHG